MSADCVLQGRMTMLRREGRSLISRVEKVWTSLRKAAPRLLGIVLVPSTRTSLTSHSNDSFFDRQRGPKKADELSSNGDDDFVVLFASCGHAPIAPAQPTMRFFGYRDDVRGAVQLSASGAFGSPWQGTDSAKRTRSRRGVRDRCPSW